MANDNMGQLTLAYLRRRADEGAGISTKLVTCSAIDMAVAADTVEKLLAELNHLREREAALLTVARAVADAQVVVEPDGRGALILPPGWINHRVRELAQAALEREDH